MPELPEVETVRRQLAPAVTGRTIVAARTDGHPRFAGAAAARGARLDTVLRRGKYLIFALDDGRELIVHLGMTGAVVHADAHAMDPAHLRAELTFDDGTRLRLTDTRKFGRAVVVVAGDHAGLPTLAAIGPEPLDDTFTAELLAAALAKRCAPLKTQLLSQRPVAGLGNIYVDEACHAAGIDPRRRSVTRDEARRLHAAIRAVLTVALGAGGTTFRDYRDASGGRGGNVVNLAVYGRGGEPCLTCGATLDRYEVTGRTTVSCRRCQPR